MRRRSRTALLALAVALAAACESRPATAPATAPVPTVPIDAATAAPLPPAPAAALPPRTAAQLALPAVTATCSGANLDCPGGELVGPLAGLESLDDAGTQPSRTGAVPAGCAATYVALRRRRHMLADHCVVAIQRGTAVTVADVDLQCPRAQASIAAAGCAGDEVVVAIARADRPAPVAVTCTLGGAAPACTRDALAPPADPALAAFVDEVEALVGAHAWDAVIRRTSRAHQRSQLRELGQDRPTFIAELLGAHTTDNSLTADDDPIRRADLDRIRALELVDAYTEPSPDGPWTIVIGALRLADGTTLRAQIMVVIERGALVLSGASG